jgi:hypothetical protein
MMLMLLQTTAQQVANAIPVTDPGINDTVSAISHQAGLVAITVWGLQVLKRSKLFPYLNANTETATRVVSTLCALFAALAVQISVTSGDAQHGWNGTFAIPSVHVLWDSVIRFCGQKMGQEGLYRLIYKEPAEVVPVTPPAMDAGGKPIAPPQPILVAKGD